jgi:hypothetical protein
MVVAPLVSAVTRPVPDTVATAGLLDAQVAVAVTSVIVPSVSRAAAASCDVWLRLAKDTELAPAAVTVTVCTVGVGLDESLSQDAATKPRARIAIRFRVMGHIVHPTGSKA